MSKQIPNLRAVLTDAAMEACGADHLSEQALAGIERLAAEGDFLMLTGRHDWVGKRTRDLKDYSNWWAYAMEVRITSALENSGRSVNNSIKVNPMDQSDVDLVCRDSNGVEIRAECVAAREPDDFWAKDGEWCPGVSKLVAFHDGARQANLLRKIQDKIRVKTIHKSGTPIKFPRQSSDSAFVNLIVIDVTEACGDAPDRWDMELMTWGAIAVDASVGLPILGLFELNNPYSPEFAKEFDSNKYVRERINAIIYLINGTSIQAPLCASYEGVALTNPALSMNADQTKALLAFLGALSPLVTGWLPPQRWHKDR